MKVLVSACLLGRCCKYNGGHNYDPNVAEYLKDKEPVEICPEVMAGLGVPRTPIEIVSGVLLDREGNSADEALRNAVAQVLELVRRENITCAVLKSRSPTCGVRQVYDGTFSGKLVDGSGVLAQALKDAGVQVIDAEELPECSLLAYLESMAREDTCPLVLCDTDHKIVYMNPAACERYHYAGGEALLGKSLLSCHPKQAVDRINQVLDWFCADPANNRVHTFYNAKENKDVYMIALRDRVGNLIGYYEKHEYRNRDLAPLYQPFRKGE